MGVFDEMQELRLYRQQKKNIIEVFKECSFEIANQ